MRRKIGQALIRFGRRIEGRSIPVTVVVGAGGASGRSGDTSFGTYSATGGVNFYADPGEAMKIAERLSKRWADLLQRLA